MTRAIQDITAGNSDPSGWRCHERAEGKQQRTCSRTCSCCRVANLSKFSEVKQQPFYMFSKALSQKFRQGPTGVVCLCLSWENVKQSLGSSRSFSTTFLTRGLGGCEGRAQLGLSSGHPQAACICGPGFSLVDAEFQEGTSQKEMPREQGSQEPQTETTWLLLTWLRSPMASLLLHSVVTGETPRLADAQREGNWTRSPAGGMAGPTVLNSWDSGDPPGFISWPWRMLAVQPRAFLNHSVPCLPRERNRNHNSVLIGLFGEFMA